MTRSFRDRLAPLTAPTVSKIPNNSPTRCGAKLSFITLDGETLPGPPNSDKLLDVLAEAVKAVATLTNWLAEELSSLEQKIAEDLAVYEALHWLLPGLPPINVFCVHRCLVGGGWQWRSSAISPNSFWGETRSAPKVQHTEANCRRRHDPKYLVLTYKRLESPHVVVKLHAGNGEASLSGSLAHAGVPIRDADTRPINCSGRSTDSAAGPFSCREMLPWLGVSGDWAVA